MNTLFNLARIRRVEFMVVEITILFIPILITIENFDELQNWVFFEAVILFFALYTVGDVVNCLADRDLDNSYKTHLSNAVYDLGVPLVQKIVVGFTILSLTLMAHLISTTGKWQLGVLVVFGLFLGFGYSLKPLFFKGRGILQLVCLWLLLYFVPMLYSGLLVIDSLQTELIALAASFATVEMGIILINTSEDYPEDKAEGVVTAAVSLGLKSTIALALAMTVLGGTCFFGIFTMLFIHYGVPNNGFIAIVLGIMVWIWIVWELVLLTSNMRHSSEWADITLVKSKGKLVPIWATAIGWAGMICGFVLVNFR